MNEEITVPQTPYKFSKEELRVLQQCNSDSFYQRSLPLGTLLGAGTYYAVKAGFLQPNNRFGAIPKVVAAVITGYLIGKISYQPKCAEKLMALPESRLGAMLRNRKKKGGYQESIILDAPGITKAFSELPSSETYSDVEPPSSMDIDVDRPPSGDFDDSYRPTFHDEHIDDELSLPPSQQRTTSYEDLRRRNREEYELKKTKPYRGVLTPEEVPSALKTRDMDQDTRGVWNRPTNVYGDAWEK